MYEFVLGSGDGTSLFALCSARVSLCVLARRTRAHEIIDYARRKQAGKPIGSGRMEKGVDQVVGIRQKDKGMSWSKSGSYALAMLSAYHANGHGTQLWNPDQTQA